MKKQFLLVIFVASLLCLSANSFAQQKPKTKDALVFEISKFPNPAYLEEGRSLSSSHTFYFYKSGQIGCKSVSYNLRGEEIKSTSESKCIQLTKAKINELIELAEQAEFLKAERNYSSYNGGADFHNSFSIIFYRKVGNKTIRLNSPRLTKTNLKLPESVAEFLWKIAEIDNRMKYKR